MTTDNSERIKAAADALDEAIYTQFGVARGESRFDALAILTEHFGESAPAQKEGELELRIKRIVHRVVTDRNVVVRTNGVDDDVLALARGETIEWPGFEEWCRSYEKRGYR